MLADRGVAMSSDELAIFDQPLRELPYVNVHHFLERIGVAVPGLYADGTEDGLLLLEDVGDLPLWEAVQGKAEAEVRALLRRRHRPAPDDSGRRHGVPATRAASLFARASTSVSSSGSSSTFSSTASPAAYPPPDYPPPSSPSCAVSSMVCRSISTHSRGFSTTATIHSWNLFLCDGRVRVIDFQDALLAPAPYDLATLLGDRVTRDVVDPDLEACLLDDYADGWAARGNAAWDRAELWEVYSTCALQKAFKVVGRFHYLDREKGKPGYLRYIPPTLRQIARLLDQRADLASVREILTRYFPEIAA